MMVYKYLIVGSNCKMRWEMDKLSPYVQRIPGPIDNCVLLDPMKSNDDVKSDFEESNYSAKDQVSYDSSN